VSTEVRTRRSRSTALLLAVAVVAAGCSGAEERPDVALDRPVASSTFDLAAVHAEVDAIASLAELPRVEVRITRAGDAERSADGGATRSDAGAGREAATPEVLAAVAADDVSRARGLQGVSALPADVGMLFLFPEPAGLGGRPGFWMRDTLVPLDIVFARIDEEGRGRDAQGDGVAIVVGVASMVPCAAMPCPVTHPGVDYDVALEVAAGWLDATGVGSGDVVTWTSALRR
jgi:uncharacterized membrane protein (UPF0127 family)